MPPGPARTENRWRNGKKPVKLRSVSLDDKYGLSEGRVFLTGTQALVRLNLMQRQRDLAAGLNTAGYVTGYRGSPLGGIDREFGRAKRFLDGHHVKFHPAVNEDLAATAIWGTQQVGLFERAKYDGVFGMWYGKGPGVDRSGDVFRHANMAGTAPNGGVLVMAGDDPACKSSTVPSQSEHALMDANIPILNPIDVQDLLDLGLYGWAMSRFAGVWVGVKCITDNVDTSASIDVSPDRVRIVLPEFEMPPGGLHIRWPDPPLEQEERLHRHKLYAALAFARANRLDRVMLDSSKPRFGIVSTGKAYLDTLQALEDLGIGTAEAEAIGLRLYRVAMPWPLEREGARHFAEGLEEILVVEEKRAVIENQLKEQLYNWRADVRPRVVGKFDEKGEWILPSAGELTPARIARVIAARIRNFHISEAVEKRLRFLEEKERILERAVPSIKRIPYFCAGCPHNTSTTVPEGMEAAAGIGCHYMAIWMPGRRTATFTHMGAEGANWIGQAPFTEREHIFVNIGDGTYFHSGILAIRAAVAAKVNVTYKVLYNDAVAMTGGQPMDGPLDPARISRQVRAEGVERVAVVTDEPGKYPPGTEFAPGTTIRHRDDLDRVQRDLAAWPGVSVLIYDQTCAAEKRRRRKRHTFPDPPRRVFINEAVCEGCGDCGVVSNCVAIVPKETELGRKRAIDQNVCNKDYTCLKGFCPSFVTVHGGGLAKGADPRSPDADNIGSGAPFSVLPDPALPDTARAYNVCVTGIGGTGVVTISALLGMAAHVDGKAVTVLDVAGLAQKNGAVYAHVRVADDADALNAVRIAAGGADLLLGADMVTSGGFETLAKLDPARARAVVNARRTMTADFTNLPDLEFPDAELHRAIADATAEAAFVDVTHLARRLMGDTIAANIMLLGFAYQKGWLPVSAAAVERAIELNGVAVDFNKQAFAWGRRAAHDPALAHKLAGGHADDEASQAFDLDAFIERRMADLTAYQDAAYAARYVKAVDRVRAREAALGAGGTELTEAVARSLFKLMAYKDEYEVARLYSAPAFRRSLRETFRGVEKLTLHLAPPLLAQKDPRTGHLIKREFGPWVFWAFRLLAPLKGLRGTALDPFGHTAERRMERKLIGDYEATLETLLSKLTADNLPLAAEIASLPLTMRGFGHVKTANVEKAKAREADLLAAFTDPAGTARAAE
ncbi:MAG: indolepyruvate ferredoxin oxidoreductase [Rhodospirillales bacterium CG15_BIG_FIL_POST_REV_8_21_14_020_66_15]|nr:MAG: indolepyruvate ferredoxin oxidoreductase [Rhodospirillales bacterium CG15_BIG_FIL_POST_REV_8_21_14_020_66_15]